MRHHWGPDRLINPPFLSGSNVVVRKDILAQTGFYDEKRYRNNYEDVDLSLRLKEAGFKIIYEPEALDRHLRRDNIYSVLETYWRWKFHDYKRKYIARPVFNLVNAAKLISEDIFNKNFRLIFIDMLAFLFCTYFDLKEYLRKVV